MKLRICFVCLGNICRSPTAEGVMQRLVAEAGLTERIEVDSAGTAAYHVGESADPRSRRCARARGVALTSRARRFDTGDFQRFDYVLAMDRDNYDDLRALSPDAPSRAKIHLLRSFAKPAPDEIDVPDPYYGGEGGFERVFDICEAACRGLLEHLRRRHGLEAPREERGSPA